MMDLRELTTACLQLQERVRQHNAAGNTRAHVVRYWVSNHTAPLALATAHAAVADGTTPSPLRVSDAQVAELARLTAEFDRLAAAPTPRGTEERPPAPAVVATAAWSSGAASVADFAADRALLFAEGPTGTRGAAGGVPPGHTPYTWQEPPPLSLLIVEAQDAVGAGLQALGRGSPAATRPWLHYWHFCELVDQPAVRAALERVRGEGRDMPASSRPPRSPLRAPAPLPPSPAPLCAVLGLGAGGLLSLYLRLHSGVASRGYDGDAAALFVARTAAAVVGWEAGDGGGGGGSDSSGSDLIGGDVAAAPSIDGTLSRSAIVFVDSASLGADPSLRRVLYSKLVTQLPQGAIVVDTLPVTTAAARPLSIPLFEAHTPRGVVLTGTTSPRSPLPLLPALSQSPTPPPPLLLMARTSSGSGAGGLEMEFGAGAAAAATSPAAFPKTPRLSVGGGDDTLAHTQPPASSPAGSASATLRLRARSRGGSTTTADVSASSPRRFSDALALLHTPALIRHKVEVRGLVALPTLHCGLGPGAFYVSRLELRVEARGEGEAAASMTMMSATTSGLQGSGEGATGGRTMSPEWR